MINEELKAYVAKADDDEVRVKVLDPLLNSALAALGFAATAEPLVYSLQVADDPSKATVFEALRALGVAFSAGKEWCPSEVFEYLREQGLLSGTFVRVAWTQPGQYRLTHE